MINTKRLKPQALRMLAPTVDKTPIEIMSPREAFDNWLRYEGIIGFTDSIIYMLDALRAAEGES